MIHRGTNHCEIQPRRRSDISVADVAQMQRQAEVYLGLAGYTALEISHRDLFRSRVSRSQSGRASLARIFVRAQLENRQHSVAHELERLAALRTYDIDHRFEVIVEQPDYFVARQRVGH